jgi:Ca2+-binding EF-hand superfamily protein
VLATGWLTVSLFAQSPDATSVGAGPPGSGGRPGFRGPGGRRGSRGLPIVAQQMLSQGDKDGDKELTKQEFISLADAWFDKLDPEKTGKLNQEQLVSRLRDILPTASSARGPVESSSGTGRAPDAALAGVSPEVLGPILFTVTDADKDGSLTRSEFKQAFAKWFDDWDADKTGKLNEDSLRKGLEIALPRSTSGARGSDPGFRPRNAVVEVRTDAARTGGDRPSPSSQPAASPKSVVREVQEHSPGDSTVRDFATFKIITERNIFNPNRRAGRRDQGDEPKPRRTDTLNLVGTLVSEKGIYAFFDGSGSDLRKVLGPGTSIATYKIAEITTDGVKLEAGTNTVHLRVGMQMRREEEGEWSVVSGSGPPARLSAASSASVGESSGGDDSDIVKRLMQQREQELK